jgi:putative hydrolase of the HAD superfamily
MIFFDLDGTLLDHKDSEYFGVKAFYNEYKHEILIEEGTLYKLWCEISNKYFQKYSKGEITFNQQRVQRIQEIFNLSDIQLSDEEAKRRFDIYLNKYEDNWKPFNDVISCLKGLTEYRLGIISNGDLEQQSLKLERLGIKNYFEIIVTSGEVGIAKPNIKLFKIACNGVKEHPNNCYYIGDDIATDILPCKEIGMHGIWLNRNGGQTTFSNIVTINNLSNLKNILL